MTVLLYMCVSGGRKGSRTLTKNICKSPIAIEVQRTVQGADLPKYKRCCCREVMLWIAQAAADVVPEIRQNRRDRNNERMKSRCIPRDDMSCLDISLSCLSPNKIVVSSGGGCRISLCEVEWMVGYRGTCFQHVIRKAIRVPGGTAGA